MEEKKEDYDYLLKLLLVGDSGTGAKTSFLIGYVDDVYDTCTGSTISVDIRIKIVEVYGKRVKLQIWDTAGQERFRTIVSSFFRGAHGFVLGYSITNRNSFESLGTWMKLIKYNTTEVPVMLIGNKCDLEERKVSYEEGLKFLQENGIKLFFESK